MNTQQKLANLILQTLVRAGVKPGSEGLLDTMKDAVVGVHVILRDQAEVCNSPECNRECLKCNRADCPIEGRYRKCI